MIEKFEDLNNCDPFSCSASKIMVVHRVISGIYRKHLKDFGLSNSQFSILMVLSKGGDKSQVELTKILYLDKSSVNRNLTRLVGQKFVHKLSEGKISITEKGMKNLNASIPSWEKAKEETKMKLGDHGYDALIRVFNQLTLV